MSDGTEPRPDPSPPEQEAEETKEKKPLPPAGPRYFGPRFVLASDVPPDALTIKLHLISAGLGQLWFQRKVLREVSQLTGTLPASFWTNTHRFRVATVEDDVRQLQEAIEALREPIRSVFIDCRAVEQSMEASDLSRTTWVARLGLYGLPLNLVTQEEEPVRVWMRRAHRLRTACTDFSKIHPPRRY